LSRFDQLAIVAAPDRRLRVIRAPLAAAEAGNASGMLSLGRPSFQFLSSVTNSGGGGGSLGSPTSASV